METHTIRKGTVNAKPNTTALRYTRNGIVWRGRFRLWDMEGDYFVFTKPTHIKLAGLYWSGWNVFPRMREGWNRGVSRVTNQRESHRLYMAATASLRQIPAWTHTNSIRLIARWETRDASIDFDGRGSASIATRPKERGVAISTYVYLDGQGSATTHSPVRGQEIAWLKEDESKPGWTVEGEVVMRLLDDGPVPFVGIYAPSTTASVPIPRRPWFFGLCSAHANNGPSSKTAPCDLEWEAETERI